MDQGRGGSGSGRNVVVIIAHGVGEADSGYPAMALSDALVKSGAFRCDDDARVRHLPESQAPRQDPNQTFPAFISHGQLSSGERLTFAELYWADLTKVGPTRMDAILGFFRIVFESHHFIDAMLKHHKGAAPRMLRQLLLIASWLLRGPIIGLVITTSVLFWVALYTLPRAVEVVTETALFGLASALLFLFSGAVYFWAVRRRDETWYDPAAWTALTSAVIALAFAGLWYFEEMLVSGCPVVRGQPPDCRQVYIDAIYNSLLKYSWRLWGAIILVAFLVALYVWLRRKTLAGAPPALMALGVVLLQFVLWTAIIGTALMPLLYRAEEIKGINALRMAATPLPPEAETHPAALRLLNVVAWDPQGSKWIDRVSLGYGFNGVMILSILLVGASTHLARQLLARRHVRGKSIDISKMPRIVVGRWILGALMFVTFFQALYLMLGMDLEDFAEFFEWGAGARDLATKWKHTIFAIGWISALALPVLASFRLGNFIHIARDLIDHHYSQSRASRLARLPAKLRDKEQWPRRARIQGRLLALLEEVVPKERFDQAIFVAHSQGSVIAFDYLKEAAPLNKELGGLKPDVVTLGSPLAHLYQHYFYEYVGLERDVAALRNNIGRWVNLYRVDDYIGTSLMLGPEAGIHNVEIGLGGHTDYWKEDQLARVILELVRTHP
jgi:hypothetical protein